MNGLDNTMNISTYLDSFAAHSNLLCAIRPKLVFRCWIDKGPGMMGEHVRFHYGPSVCREVIALWISSDWGGGSKTKAAIAWTKDKNLLNAPWVSLLRAYWEAEKSENLWEEPNYSEIDVSPRSLMTPPQVEEVARSVWPNWSC